MDGDWDSDWGFVLLDWIGFWVLVLVGVFGAGFGGREGCEGEIVFDCHARTHARAGDWDSDSDILYGIVSHDIVTVATR